MVELAQRGKGFWTAVGIVILLIVVTPYVRWIPVNVFDLFGVIIWILSVSGYFVFEGLRYASEWWVNMVTGRHVSRSRVSDMVFPGTPGRAPSRDAVTTGGLEVTHLTIANRDTCIAPKSAVERVDTGEDREDYLVYAPGVTMTAEQFFGFDSAMAGELEQDVSNAFRTGEGSKSKVWFTPFIELAAQTPAESLRFLSDEVLSRAMKNAEGKRKGEKHGKHNIRELRKIHEITRRPSLTERILSALGLGGGSTSSVPADKPSGEEGE